MGLKMSEILLILAALLLLFGASRLPQLGTSLGSGQTLTVRRSTKPVQLVRFKGNTFFSRLRRKLGWGGLVERDR